MKLRTPMTLRLGLAVSLLPYLFSACGPSESIPPTPAHDSAAKAQTPPAPKPAASQAKSTPETPKPTPAAAPPAAEAPKPPVVAKPQAAAPIPATKKEPEYLLNGSFEKVDGKGAPECWYSDDPKAGLDTKARSGEHSMKIHPSMKSGEIRHLFGDIRNAATVPGKHFRIAATVLAKTKAKADQAKTKASAQAPLAFHVVYVVDGKEHEIAKAFNGNDDWAEFALEGEIPANADPKRLRFIVAVRSTAADPVLVDNVIMTIK